MCYHYFYRGCRCRGKFTAGHATCREGLVRATGRGARWRFTRVQQQARRDSAIGCLPRATPGPYRALSEGRDVSCSALLFVCTLGVVVQQWVLSRR